MLLRRTILKSSSRWRIEWTHIVGWSNSTSKKMMWRPLSRIQYGGHETRDFIHHWWTVLLLLLEWLMRSCTHQQIRICQALDLWLLLWWSSEWIQEAVDLFVDISFLYWAIRSSVFQPVWNLHLINSRHWFRLIRASSEWNEVPVIYRPLVSP